MRRRTRRAGAALAVLAAAGGGLAGCAAASTGAPLPRATTPSASPTPTAGEALAVLARRGLSASYTASYRLRSAGSRTAATLRVARTPTALRVDVVSGRTDAMLLQTAQGDFSCRLAGGPVVCLRVAAAGGALPATFDPGVERVFAGYLTAFAAGGLPVRGEGATAPSSGVPAATCFRVSAGAGSPSAAPLSATPAAGTYCLDADGVPTKVAFAAGGSLVASSVGPAPSARELVPPAAPTPLPTSS